MYILSKKNDRLNRQVNDYFCDTEEDKNQIPKEEITMGSSAFVIATRKVYLADSLKEWHEM